MSSPSKPIQSPSIAGTRGVSKVGAVGASQAVKGTFKIGESRQISAPQEVNALDSAINQVGADIRSGDLSDESAVMDAVILRLVQLRFGSLERLKKDNLLMHLRGTLKDDPYFQSRIQQLIEESGGLAR